MLAFMERHPNLRALTLVACGALATCYFGYLCANPIYPYANYLAVIAVVAFFLLYLTAQFPLWLFPLIAALSTIIYSVTFAGANVTPADLVVPALMGAALMKRSRQPWPPGARLLMLAYSVFLGVCFLSLPFGGNTSFGVQKIIQRSEYLIVFVCTISLLSDLEMLRKAIHAYILTTVFLSLVLIGFALQHGIHYGGVNVLFYNKNNSASFLTIGLALVTARLVFGEAHKRGSWLVSAGLLSIALILTGSRGAWIGALIAFGIAMVWKNRAWLTYYVIGSVLLVVAANAILPQDLVRSNELRPSNLIGAGANLQSGKTVLSRIVIWQGALKIIAAHPLLGVGAGAYLDSQVFNGDHNFSTNDPHNAVLYMWAELGTIGLAAFLWLLYATYRIFRGAISAARGTPNFWLAAGCATAITSYLIFTLSEPIWTRGDGLIFFLLVGIGARLATLQMKPETERQEPVPTIAAVVEAFHGSRRIGALPSPR